MIENTIIKIELTNLKVCTAQTELKGTYMGGVWKGGGGVQGLDAREVAGKGRGGREGGREGRRVPLSRLAGVSSLLAYPPLPTPATGLRYLC